MSKNKLKNPCITNMDSQGQFDYKERVKLIPSYSFIHFLSMDPLVGDNMPCGCNEGNTSHFPFLQLAFFLCLQV